MIKAKKIHRGAKRKISSGESNSPMRRIGRKRPPSSPTGSPKERGGAFTHVGAIGPQGRESYQKLSAVFGPRTYPGSSCGISILGAGSISNLRKLI